MIARTWKGVVRAEDAAAYVEYLERTGFAGFRETAGNAGYLGLRRIDGDRCEFLVISLWDSIDDVKRFAGDHVETAVFYPEDDRFLIERETTATHFEVVGRA